MIATALTVLAALSLPALADPAAEFENDQHAIDCAICRTALVPTVVAAVEATRDKQDAKGVVEAAVRPLAKSWVVDTATRSVTKRNDSSGEEDRAVTHYVSSMLWDPDHARQLYSLVYLYHDDRKRRPLFTAMADHVLCTCTEAAEVGDEHRMHAYLQKHQLSMLEMLQAYPYPDTHFRADDPHQHPHLEEFDEPMPEADIEEGPEHDHGHHMEAADHESEEDHDEG